MNKIFYSINYVWRIIATSICFSLFGTGGIILGGLIIPSLKFFVSDPERKKDRAQYMIHRSFQLFIFTMSALGLIDFKFNGFEKLQKDKGCLFISNHPTLIDYVAIISKLKRCDNIVKEALWRNPFLRMVVESADYIPNLQSEETFNLIKETLYKGNNLLMFPEGTRSTPGQPINLKRGAAQIAIRANVPIRVIKITCIPSTLTKHNKWYKVAKTKPTMTLTAGKLIQPKEFLEKTGLPSLAARHLTQHLKEILEEK